MARWERIYFLVLGPILLVACLVLLGRNGANEQSQPQASEVEESVQKDAPNWADEGMLVFTGILTLVTGWQILLWRRANNTAEAALNEAAAATLQTKRTVDAYISAERGRLLYDTTTFHKGVMHVAFRNVGPGTVVIETMGVRLRDTDNMEIRPLGTYLPNRRFLMRTPVVTGATLVHDYYLPRAVYFHHGPLEKEVRDDWAVQFSIIYTTMGLRTHYWCNVIVYDTGVLKGAGEGYETEQDIPDQWPDATIVEAETRLDETIVEQWKKRGHYEGFWEPTDDDLPDY